MNLRQQRDPPKIASAEAAAVPQVREPQAAEV